MSNISLNYAQIIDPLSFKSINLAKIYIGEYGTLPNPAVSGTWKQAYFVNSDGTRTAASQPIRTNAAGYAVDGSGNIKTIQVDGGYSLLVQDQLNVTKFSQACSPVNDGAVLEFDTIAGFTGALDGSVCYFNGRDTVGDGGGGIFRYSASSTQTADGGIVFAPSGGGRLFRDWSGESASIAWFYSEADGEDWGPALIRAVTACDHVVFPDRQSGYDFTTAVSAALLKDKIIDFNGQRCVFSGAGRVTLSGQLIASGRSLAANADRYATSVQLNSTAGVQAGDLFYINTSIAPSTSWSDTKKDLVRIRAVSGSSLILDEGLNFHYTTADAGLDVLIYRPVKLTMIRPNLQLIAADGEAITKIMFMLEGLRDVYVDRPEIKGSYPFNRSLNFYRNGIYFYRCWGGVIQSPVYETMSYPCGIYGGSRHFIENDVHARYMHHAHADVGDWSADYLLNGMNASDGYQSLNTHVCFRAHAVNFNVRNDFGNSNWRVCGGSIKDGYLHSTATDAAELPQFQNNDPAAGYEYINADADFNAENITFDTPKEVPFGVRYGRTVKYSGVKANAVVVGFNTGEVALYINGAWNQIGVNNLPSPDVSSVKATLSRYDAPSGRTPTVTNASSLTLPMGHSSYLLSGTAVVEYISPVGHDSKTVSLVCSAYTEFKDNVGNLVLAGDYVAAAGMTIALTCVGNAWYEVGRSPN